jgi:flagellar hook assembly protein FlgD
MMEKIIVFLVFGFWFPVSSYAARAYPNPWIPDSKTTSNVHGTYHEGIKFDGLSNSGGTIFIYNSTGELVRKVMWSSGYTNAVWDGKNDISEYVASGVYIWVVKDGGSKSGKIVIIR